MIKNFLTLSFLLLFFVESYAIQPWFTGPLLAPASTTTAANEFFLEQYFTHTNNYKTYNNHWYAENTPDFNVASYAPTLGIGLSNWVDLTINGNYSLNDSQGQKSVGLTDPQFVLGFQLLSQHDNSLMPNLRVTLGESIPVGRYQNLSSTKKGTDSFGNGVFINLLSFNFGRLDLIQKDHYLTSGASFLFTFPSAGTVENLNAYGGGAGTNGRISPGMSAAADISFEYQLTQNWVSVFEGLYTYTGSNRFSGNTGGNNVGAPPAAKLSFAPAIEYNFSQVWGAIFGCWFTATGRNTYDFASMQLAINYNSNFP